MKLLVRTAQFCDVRLTDSLSNFPQPLERLVAMLDARGGLENMQVGGEASDAAVAQSGALDPADVRLEVKENRRLLPAEVAELVDAYRSGASQAELTRRFEIHRDTVRRHLMGQGVERRPCRVLTEAQEDEAVRLYVDETWTLAELAGRFGVGQTAVRNVLVRRGVGRRERKRRGFKTRICG